MQQRGMAWDRTATITVLWGLTEKGGGQSIGGTGSVYNLNPEFDCTSIQAQEALHRFCDDAGQAHDLRVFRTTCWIQDFATFQHRMGGAFPSRTLRADLRKFLEQQPHWVGRHIGFDTDGHGPIWVTVDFRVEFDTHSSGRSTKPYMEKWEKFSEGQATFSERLALGPPVALADVFERAEAELRVIGSALSSWLVSVACALAAVVAFTRNFTLSAAATYSIFATAACSMWTITSVFQWHFGLMEAVSLIIFCGFSVDYPLHVVQAHITAHEDNGGSYGARGALREVGCAVISGCATTCGAALFLLVCEIRIFTRFGQVLICNMMFSLAFALLWIPATLELRDPLAKRPARELVSLTSVDVEPPEGFAALPPDTPRARAR